MGAPNKKIAKPHKKEKMLKPIVVAFKTKTPKRFGFEEKHIKSGDIIEMAQLMAVSSIK